MTKSKPRVRKKLFIDPVVQGALVRRLCLHWLYANLAIFVCLLFLQVMTQGVDKPLRYHFFSLWETYGILAVVLFCVVPVFIYDTIKMSHRFAGPIYNVRANLKRLAAGETIPEIKFRKGDFWADIAQDVNQIAARLHGQPKNVASEEDEDAVKTS